MKLLEVNHLSRRYGDFIAVDDISFDLQAGELLALIGPNGAGKTTTFNMIGGQLPITGGSILLAGKSIANLPARQIWKKGVGRTFQIAATFSSFTVLQNIQNALLAHHRRTYHIWQSADKLYRDQARALLEQVGMLTQADRPCSELAYGDVKRVELAMALASEPRLLLMDEPTAGMAPRERQDLMTLTRDIAQARNTAVLFTEHSMDVVFGFADRILVLARGKLIAQGTPHEIRDNPKVRQVYFGTGLNLQQAGTPASRSTPGTETAHGTRT
ncbi:MAG TPA: ABC transporter ATP-binding protein [Advenella sp.]|nr:ABC transporter ATP-binding protein [Advenella sp.]